MNKIITLYYFLHWLEKFDDFGDFKIFDNGFVIEFHESKISFKVERDFSKEVID